MSQESNRLKKLVAALVLQSVLLITLAVVLLRAGAPSEVAQAVRELGEFIARVAWPAIVLSIFVLLRHPIAQFISEMAEVTFPGGSAKRGDAEARQLREQATTAASSDLEDRAVVGEEASPAVPQAAPGPEQAPPLGSAPTPPSKPAPVLQPDSTSEEEPIVPRDEPSRWSPHVDSGQLSGEGTVTARPDLRWDGFSDSIRLLPIQLARVLSDRHGNLSWRDTKRMLHRARAAASSLAVVENAYDVAQVAEALILGIDVRSGPSMRRRKLEQLGVSPDLIEVSQNLRRFRAEVTHRGKKVTGAGADDYVGSVETYIFGLIMAVRSRSSPSSGPDPVSPPG